MTATRSPSSTSVTMDSSKRRSTWAPDDPPEDGTREVPGRGDPRVVGLELRTDPVAHPRRDPGGVTAGDGRPGQFERTDQAVLVAKRLSAVQGGAAAVQEPIGQIPAAGAAPASCFAITYS